MDRKHLMDLIRFSSNAEEADAIIREHVDLETEQEKIAYLKGMFDCLDDFVDEAGSTENRYKEMLEHIIVNSIVEEKITIQWECCIRVVYWKQNEEGDRSFVVYVPGKCDNYATLKLSLKKELSFIDVDELVEGIQNELEEKIKKAYPVERLEKIYNMDKE